MQVNIYNKELLANKGISPPTTVDELLDSATKLTNPDLEIYGLVNRWGRGAGFFPFTAYLHTFGGEWFDEDWHPILNNEAGIAAAEFVVESSRKAGPPGISSYTWYECVHIMQEGKCAMFTDSNVFVPVLIDPSVSKIADKVGVARWPEGPGGWWPNYFCWSWGIPAVGKKKDVAWLFAEWTASYPVQLWQAAGTLMPSVRSSTYEYTVIKKTWPEDYLRLTAESMGHCKTCPWIAEWPELSDRWCVHQGKMIEGTEGVKEAVDAWCKEAEEVMRKAGYL